MSTKAISYATANIVSTEEKGAAFAIDIPVEVTVELTKGKKISGKISPELKKLAKEILAFFGYPKYGLKIEIKNKIPEGLGREEAVSLTLIFAIAGEIAKKHGSINELKIDKFLSEQFLIIDKKNFDKKKLLKLCTNANKKLKFEKLVASLYGGFAVTENKEKKILRRGDMEELFFEMHKIKIQKKANLENELNQAWNEALRGNLYTAMKLNALPVTTKKLNENALTVSYSSPYLLTVFRNKKSNNKTENSGAKIIEKPLRIYKIRDMLRLSSVKEHGFC